jgi:hypothetical protein
VARDAPLDPAERSERAVHELRRERSIARVELQRAFELRIESGSGERIVVENARDDLRRDATRGA